MSMSVRLLPQKKVLDKVEALYSDFKPVHIEAVQALFILSADLEKSMDSYFQRKHGFSRSRFLFLLILLHADEGRMTANEMAKALNVTKGNITGLMEGLRLDGLVRKAADELDGRLVWIEISDAGRKKMKEIFPDYFRRMGQLMGGLSRQELETFVQLSRKLHQLVPAFSVNAEGRDVFSEA
jgi:DNA-binding MarR family transcriptional regulator